MAELQPKMRPQLPDVPAARAPHRLVAHNQHLSIQRGRAIPQPSRPQAPQPLHRRLHDGAMQEHMGEEREQGKGQEGGTRASCT